MDSIPKSDGDRELTTAEKSFIGRSARLELARRFAAKKDILNWGRMLFPRKFTRPFCQSLHSHFVNTRNCFLTNTEAPRDSSKTTISCFLIPIFQALEEPKTYRHYLNVQSTYDKAVGINLSIKFELEENETLRALYGHQVGPRWNEAQFVLRNGVVFTAVGEGQSIRGLNYRNARPDYVIVDDFYDEEDIWNPERTLKKNAWFWSSLYPAVAKDHDWSIHFQGTAINNEDLLEKLKSLKSWTSATFRSIIDESRKEVLWPERETYEQLCEMRAGMSETIFLREKQNERRDEASAIIKESWLRGWEYDDIDYKFGPGQWEIVQARLGVDPSIGERDTSDYTAIARVLKIRHTIDGTELFLIDGLRNERLSLNERVEAVQAEAIGHSPRLPHVPIGSVLIEGIGGFKDFANTVAGRTSLPVTVVDRVPNKLANLDNKSHFFQNGKIKISRGIPDELRQLLHSQLTSNNPRHDDLRDAVLLCLDGDFGRPYSAIGGNALSFAAPSKGDWL